MKKWLAGMISFAMLVALSGCLGNIGVSGENITDIWTTDNMVYFDPKCPKCDHIGYTKQRNMSDGEEYRGSHQCEACHQIFDIYIKR